MCDLDQVIPSRSGHQLISAQRSRRVVMALEGSPCGKAGLNGPNLVNISEVPASRTLLFDLRESLLDSGIKIYYENSLSGKSLSPQTRTCAGGVLQAATGHLVHHPIER
jgi:hypothetical protein